MSTLSQKFQEVFLYEEDNYKAIILRELAIYGEGAQLKRFYVDLFQGQYFSNNRAEAHSLNSGCQQPHNPNSGYQQPHNPNSGYEQEETFHDQKPLIDLADF